jgi:hypothetical protein
MFKLSILYRQRRSEHHNWRNSGEAAAEKGITEQRKAQRGVECQADPAHNRIYRRDGGEPQEKKQRGASPSGHIGGRLRRTAVSEQVTNRKIVCLVPNIKYAHVTRKAFKIEVSLPYIDHG